MSVGVSEKKMHLSLQLLDLCSVQDPGEASAKDKFLCYHALLIIDGVEYECG
jgi:hypothetical protein